MNAPIIGFLRVAQIVNQPAKGGRPARAGIVPVSAATWWNWVKSNRAPQPVRLSPGVTVWRAEEVLAIAEKVQGGAA